jgi:hypothetical protein
MYIYQHIYQHTWYDWQVSIAGPIVIVTDRSRYYENRSTGETQWEHPLDGHYRELAAMEKAKMGAHLEESEQQRMALKAQAEAQADGEQRRREEEEAMARLVDDSFG